MDESWAAIHGPVAHHPIFLFFVVGICGWGASHLWLLAAAFALAKMQCDPEVWHRGFLSRASASENDRPSPCQGEGRLAAFNEGSSLYNAIDQVKSGVRA